MTGGSRDLPEKQPCCLPHSTEFQLLSRTNNMTQHTPHATTAVQTKQTSNSRANNRGCNPLVRSPAEDVRSPAEDAGGELQSHVDGTAVFCVPQQHGLGLVIKPECAREMKRRTWGQRKKSVLPSHVALLHCDRKAFRGSCLGGQQLRYENLSLPREGR